mgnify:CR=1 FL=1
MPTLTSKLNVRSEEFKAASTLMRQVVADLGAKLEQIAQGGGEVARARHTARGKLLPRERVEMLLDPDTPFLEIGPLAALDLYDNAAPGAGLITGVGRVSMLPTLHGTTRSGSRRSAGSLPSATSMVGVWSAWSCPSSPASVSA